MNELIWSTIAGREQDLDAPTGREFDHDARLTSLPDDLDFRNRSQITLEQIPRTMGKDTNRVSSYGHALDTVNPEVIARDAIDWGSGRAIERLKSQLDSLQSSPGQL